MRMMVEIAESGEDPLSDEELISDQEDPEDNSFYVH